MRPVRRLVLLRPPSRRTELVSARDDIQAGNSPDATAASSIATTLMASAAASTLKVIQDGGGLSRLRTALDSQLVAPYAIPTPTMAPAPATSRLSVNIWPISRLRRAP